MHDRPLTAAGKGQKRLQPIPAKVRDALRLMVYGRLDDENCEPLDFIAAAKECDIRPDQMRRYLDRPNVRAFLLAERRAFRSAICASNEASLLDVRNNSANGMARIAAVRALEQMEETDTTARPGGVQRFPGLTVIINSAIAAAPPRVIEHDDSIPPPADPRAFGIRAAPSVPAPPREIEHRPADPVFKPPR